MLCRRGDGTQRRAVTAASQRLPTYCGWVYHTALVWRVGARSPVLCTSSDRAPRTCVAWAPSELTAQCQRALLQDVTYTYSTLRRYNHARARARSRPCIVHLLLGPACQMVDYHAVRKFLAGRTAGWAAGVRPPGVRRPLTLPHAVPSLCADRHTAVSARVLSTALTRRRRAAWWWRVCVAFYYSALRSNCCGPHPLRRLL